MPQFIAEAIKDFKTIGSPLPSQHFLVKKVTSELRHKNCKIIVELGAGNGAITRGLVGMCGDECHILAFEIKERFADSILNCGTRVTHIAEDEMNFPNCLQARNIEKVDAVISSLPLAQVPREKVDKLLHSIYESLKPDGLYIQYQYSTTTRALIEEVFETVKIDFVSLNFPPAFVYVCSK